MSFAALDPVIHSPKRLAVMSILANATTTDFRFLKEHLAVSDSDLSKQMAVLIDAGYVAVTKTSRGRGGATSYRITRAGSKAFRSYRSVLDAIITADGEGGRQRQGLPDGPPV